LVISENIASWVSFYFRTSTFENVLYHWSVSYAAFPFTLCRGFFTPHNRPCTPKSVGTFYMQGYKVKGKTAIVPPVSKLSGHPAMYTEIRWGIEK
jgi:hypothetical protein